MRTGFSAEIMKCAACLVAAPHSAHRDSAGYIETLPKGWLLVRAGVRDEGAHERAVYAVCSEGCAHDLWRKLQARHGRTFY